MAFIKASAADKCSALVTNSRFRPVGFKGLSCARVIRARHFPGSCSNALMRNDLYFIPRPVAFACVHRRDGKVGKSFAANSTKAAQFPSPRRPRSDVIGTSLIAGHGSAESVRRQRPWQGQRRSPIPLSPRRSELRVRGRIAKRR